MTITPPLTGHETLDSMGPEWIQKSRRKAGGAVCPPGSFSRFHWRSLVFPTEVSARFATNDMVWISFRPEHKAISAQIEQYTKATDAWLNGVKSPADLKEQLGARCEVMPADTMFVRDSAWQFQNRREVADATPRVRQPARH